MFVQKIAVPVEGIAEGGFGCFDFFRERTVSVVGFSGMSVDDLETDFLGRCQPPAKIGADQKAGDLISQVRIFINFCRIGIVNLRNRRIVYR